MNGESGSRETPTLFCYLTELQGLILVTQGKKHRHF